MAASAAASLAAVNTLDTNLPRHLPILNSSVSAAAPTLSLFSRVEVWRNPVPRLSGKAQCRPLSRALFDNGAAETRRASDSRFPGCQMSAQSFSGFGLHENAAERSDSVAAEDSLEGLFLSSDEAVAVDEEGIGTDAESLEEGGPRVVYLESWQMKKMIAASNLGAHCVNVEVLAAEVGLESSDVFAWLENAPSKPIILSTASEGASYMEDVHILEETENPAAYVPPPPIPTRDVNMREKVENLLYTLKDMMSGPVAEIVADEKKWDTMVKLFHEKVELQNPLFCFRGRDVLLEWIQLLGLSGVVVKLHDVYYENSVKSPYIRWVYAQWTATLADDLPTRMGQLGLTDWWARYRPELGSSPDLEKQHAEEHESMKNTVLLLSGECRFEMDESGQVTNVHTKWYKLAEHGGEDDFIDAKLWLSGILSRGLQ